MCGSILEVTGWRNPPNPCVVFVVLLFVSFWKNCIPGKYLGFGSFASVKSTFLGIFDMHLAVFDILGRHLVITLLIHLAITLVTVTDGGNCNQFVKQLVR